MYICSMQYFVHEEASALVSKFANFLSTKAWFDPEDEDAFYRSPSFLNWDRRRSAVVLQEKRAWISGLSDECGASPGVSMASILNMGVHLSIF